ncbi:MAG: acyl carrier protein [Nitrospinota bacterium]|nr:acyl carrier protein [Nitrospinota bacterium]MDH5677063.1 acyl carrier protein [Nitrospinota bacterium]MDH5755295.1 acyl carrier protein [Nitrospinota bacterium]
MTGEGIRQAILEIINEIVPDEDLANVDPKVPFRDQIDLDSMDFLDIVMELRKRYSVEVPEQDYPQLLTLSSTVDYLLPKMESL